MRLLSYLAALGLALVLTAPHCHAGEEDQQKVKINLAGIDLATVARQVERITKKSFLFDENTLRGKRVTLQSETPITPTEFYRVFQAVCQTNDLILIPVENAGIDLEKIVKSQGAIKEPGAQPILIRGDKLPPNDSLVSYLVKLKYASPARVTSVLTPNLSSAGTIIQIQNTELLMISDVASSVRRAEKILTLLDVPGEPAAALALPVTHLSVDNAQTLITQYLQAMTKAEAGEAGRERITIIKDDRLNILHLIGPAKDLAQAQTFMKLIDVDAPASRRTIQYYKLKNVAAKDIVDYVDQLLGLALSTRESAEKPAAVPTPAPAPRSTAPIEPASPSPPLAAKPPSTSPAPAPRPPAAIKPARAREGKSSNVPDVDIIPVDGLNTLVVVGDANVQKEVQEIIANLDRRKGQVLIEVAIVQVNGDDSFDLGVEGLKLKGSTGDQHLADVGTSFGIGKQSDTKSRGFPVEDAVPGFTGAAFRFVNQDRLQVVISALADKSNVSIVSQPILLVNDNEEASFTTKVSQPTITTSQGTATTNTSFSGFADATTSLTIVPHISPDGYMNLEITQTFEEFTGAPAGAGIPPPKTSNNAVTKVTIPDRQTIVIGGFTRDSASDSRSGVPGLMNIPGIGKLFSKENKRKTTNRLYLFVRPKILTTEGFADLERESGIKKDDVQRLSKGSKIKGEIDEHLGAKAEIIAPDETEVRPRKEK